jgi:hypothetical protein
MKSTGRVPDPERPDSPIWRICNIYSIKNKHGKTVPFRPNKSQRKVLRAIFIEGKKKLFIPKARQLGISTLIGIIILDSLLFGSGVQCSIADFVAGNAKKKLERIINFAFEKLPPQWKAGWQKVVHNRQTGEWRIRRVGAPVEDDSVVFAGDSARGDTYQILHLSELGETQVKAPERAAEIFEGAIETAELSNIIIETTWHGGKVGVLYSLVKKAIETPDELKDRDRDYFVLFFPWFEEPNYVNHGSAKQIRQETINYFNELSQKTEVRFSEPQMLWYQNKKDNLGHRIYSVYPSLLEEIFLAPVDGAIYAQEIDEARVNGRVGAFPHDPSKPVHTLWDFGSPKNTVVLYFQCDGPNIRFIDADVIEGEGDKGKGVVISGLNMTMDKRVQHMMGKGYQYGIHYLPHDGGSRSGDLKWMVTWQATLEGLGLPGKFTVIPRTTDGRNVGINKIKTMFGVFYFDKKCSVWLDGLAMYRWREDPSDPQKFLSDPVHDFASHLADPLRVLAEAELKGYLEMEDSMNTNMVLDGERIKAVAASAKKPTIGIIEGDEFIAFRMDAAGWMQQWEPPMHRLRYMAACHDGASQVWRAAYVSESGEKIKPALVASIITPKHFDHDIHTQWSALMFRLYQANVAATINSREDIIRDLSDAGCSLYARTVSMAKMPQGRKLPPRKLGYDLDDQNREGVVSVLVRMFREAQIEINDNQWLSEAMTFIENEHGERVAQSGCRDIHIMASAVAVSLIDLGIEYRLPGSNSRLLKMS